MILELLMVSFCDSTSSPITGLLRLSFAQCRFSYFCNQYHISLRCTNSERCPSFKIPNLLFFSFLISWFLRTIFKIYLFFSTLANNQPLKFFASKPSVLGLSVVFLSSAIQKLLGRLLQ